MWVNRPNDEKLFSSQNSVLYGQSQIPNWRSEVKVIMAFRKEHQTTLRKKAFISKLFSFMRKINGAPQKHKRWMNEWGLMNRFSKLECWMERKRVEEHCHLALLRKMNSWTVKTEIWEVFLLRNFCLKQKRGRPGKWQDSN